MTTATPVLDHTMLLIQQWGPLVERLPRFTALRFVITWADDHIVKMRSGVGDEQRECHFFATEAERALREVFSEGPPTGTYVSGYFEGHATGGVTNEALSKMTETLIAMQFHLLLPALRQWEIIYKRLPTDECIREILGQVSVLMQAGGHTLDDVTWHARSHEEVSEMMEARGWIHLRFITTNYDVHVIVKKKQVYIGFMGRERPFKVEMHGILLKRIAEALRQRTAV